MEKRMESPKVHRAVRRVGRVPLLGLALFGLLYLQFLYLPSRLVETSQSQLKLSEHRFQILDHGLSKCASNKLSAVRHKVPPSLQRANPRWSKEKSNPVVVTNATLFDGTSFMTESVNILMDRGIITAVTPAAQGLGELSERATVLDAAGRYVTPGLVDMHSHHISSTWPGFEATEDTNEVNDETGPLTPQVRVLDTMKAYDPAATLIASGGVTASLILPGSANIMGGEAYPVKNVLRSGVNGEEVVEELLLEHGIPYPERQRYMKMACGENPKRVYDHTRMGNAWKFRSQMAKGKDLMAKQDAWCLSAAAAKESGDVASIRELVEPTIADKGGYPEELALDSTVAMLRGQVNVNIHCYEPEDFEDMLRHNEEFNFSIAAFHHAIEAWKVPELIKSTGLNITIATFQDFAFYKHEAYNPSLHAGKILAEHGVPVAYKSDHGEEATNAKYLLFQAAGAHSFGLPADLALQAVTSVPARSMQQDHRIGHAKPGYDADLVVWDAHPLSVGATPVSVFIDGKPALPKSKDTDALITLNSSEERTRKEPQMRATLEKEQRTAFCDKVRNSQNRLVFTGIKKSFIEHETSMQFAESDEAQNNLTMIFESGQVTCIGSPQDCLHDTSNDTIVPLKNGHVLPGLTAVTPDLGLFEIIAEDATRDGIVTPQKDIFNPSSAVYAKYGVHLDGKGFQRARIGGVTRTITPPISLGTLLRGVSTGIKTTGNKTILNGGVFHDDVALHFVVGQGARGVQEFGTTISGSTVSGAIANLRRILSENKGKDSIYGKASDGKIPVVVHAVNQYDIMQLIKIKKEYADVKLVIMHGHEVPLVAKELAEAGIPLIFTAHRGAPDAWEKKDVLPGPPLSKSGAAVLVEEGVRFAVAVAGMSLPLGPAFIHNTLLEASWAAKYAGLSEKEAVNLVSRNVEDILGLERTKEIVVWEGDPLEFGGSVAVVLGLDESGKGGGVEECWPEVD